MNTDIKNFIPVTNITESHHKDKGLFRAYDIITFDGKEWLNPITVKIYRIDTKCYLCFWLNDKNHASGSATCKGYPYIGQAFYSALLTAGIEFNHDPNSSIGGQGEYSITYGLTVLAKYLGYKNFTLHTTN